jgi:hypothetical protein
MPLLSIRHPLSAVVVGLLSVGCGPATLQQLANEPPSNYGARCATEGTEHDKDLRELTYLRPTFKALKWKANPSPNEDGVLSEAKLLQALSEGAVRNLLIQARGGIGKSESARAMLAELCPKVPIFLVDFKALAKSGASEASVVQAVATQLSLTADSQANLGELLGKSRWILVVDALDEVAPADRPAGLTSLGKLQAKYPSLQMVYLGRPSIYQESYGIANLEAVLEMTPLDCGRARSALLRKAVDRADRDRIDGFVHAWRLDRQAVLGQQCYYPFMATYRDLDAVQRLAATFDPAKERGGQAHTLTHIHLAILSERMRKELTELKIPAEEALAAVDKMIAADGYKDGEWNLTFSVPRCLAAEGGDNDRNRHLCEELFQSVMFERIGGNSGSVKSAEWQFAHQALADLFVARWLDAGLAKGPDCQLLVEHAKALPGKEVPAYLAGLAGGQKCLAALVSGACGDGSKPELLIAQLRQGLPADPAVRSAAVQAAKAAAPKGNACFDAVLGKL